MSGGHIVSASLPMAVMGHDVTADGLAPRGPLASIVPERHARPSLGCSSGGVVTESFGRSFHVGLDSMVCVAGAIDRRSRGGRGLTGIL